MKLKDLILKNRSCRRFKENEPISEETLRNLVDLARLSPASANLQPLKYILSCEKEKNATIFRNLEWAGYLKDWKGPSEGKRPAGYIIILGDTKIKKKINCDHGIAAQSITLGATELGFNCCIVAAINKDKLREQLNIPEYLDIMLVIAIGKCAEEIELETVGSDGDIKYWRDKNDIHRVPKRRLDDIIIG